jgi:RNA polymerase sigma-70 factor (ECF subfamily)
VNDLFLLRPRLFGIAYRLLGSVSDAEDVVQEAFVRLEEHRMEELHNPAGWLATVTTRLALDRLRALKRERELYIGEWLPEPLITADDPFSAATRADDLAVGFLHVLERLHPEERTALLLHDVFDYSHAEIAQILSKSEEAARQLASRARSRVRQERPRVAVDRKKAAQLTERFLHALKQGDVSEMREILAADVVVTADGGGKVSAAVRPILGIERALRLFSGVQPKVMKEMESRIMVVNGDPGIIFLNDGSLSMALAFDFGTERILKVYAIMNPAKLRNSRTLNVP